MATNITEAQQEALDRIFKDLYEHFDGGVVAVVAQVENGTDQAEEAFRVIWAGGRVLAVGLAEEAKRAIQEQDLEDGE